MAGIFQGALQASDDIAAKGASAPRVTLDSMKAKIAERHFFTAGQAIDAIGGADRKPGPLDILTICIMVMTNGFVIIGKSAPASPANFDVEKGEVFAFEDAIKQLWPLEGYLLREQLHEQARAKQVNYGGPDLTKPPYRSAFPDTSMGEAIGEVRTVGRDRSEEPLPFGDGGLSKYLAPDDIGDGITDERL